MCNRLRTALSYYKFAQTLGEELLFTWPINDACPDRFENHFESIPGLVFTEELDRAPGHPGRHGVFPHPDFKPNFDLLVPKYNVSMLDEPHDAIHVRSSEHWVENRENPTKFKKFAKDSSRPVWLATDLRRTQGQFSGVHYLEEIRECDRIKGPHRHTSLRHSVIALFMCVNASEFLVTEFSSFSETINELRREPGDLVYGGRGYASGSPRP